MRLFFRKSGSGPPLVILHGLYGSSDNWLSIARSLADKYTVILPDLRNHGQSPHTADNTYEAMAHDINELTGELIPGRFFLAGHSMGGKVAMKYALNWPEKINAMVIFDVSPFGSGDDKNPFYSGHKKILDALLSVDLSALRTREEVERSLTVRIESERTRGFLMKNLLRTNDGSFRWKINAEALLANLPAIIDGVAAKDDFSSPVTGFPVHFVRGADSDYLSESDYNSISRLFPAVEFITVEKAGHWIHAERPDAVTHILRNMV